MQVTSLTWNEEKRLTRWRDDPVCFSREVLGKDVWDKQADLLRRIAKNRRVAVRSGHKIGKSLSACIVALWFAVTRPGARVILTSASNRQIREILWRELKALYRDALVDLGGHLADTPAGGLRWSNGSEIIGFSTDEPERMAGLSGPHLLFVCDEATGIPDEIFEAIEGNRAGGAYVVMFSNPTKTSGTFFGAFHDAADLWDRVRVSSEETINAECGEIIIPGLATADFVAEKVREWGRESSLFRVRIGGDFPTHSSNSVVGLDDVFRSTRDWNPLSARLAKGSLVAGLDVARYGDDENAICLRRDDTVPVPIHILGPGDGPDVAGKALDYVYDHMNPEEREDPTQVVLCVDIKGPGASPYDFLRYNETLPLTIVGVDVSARPRNPRKYFNTRAEMWFRAAEWFRDGGLMPHDAKLENELLAHTYLFRSASQVQIVSKEDVRKIIKRSPDRAESLCLTFCADRMAPRVRDYDDEEGPYRR